MSFSSVLDEWPIEVVSVICYENEWLCLSNVLEKLDEKASLIWLVEHLEKAVDTVFRLWAVLKILDIITDDLSICDQEAFSVNDI